MTPSDAAQTQLSDVVVTTVETPDNLHLMKSLDSTFCGATLDRETRRTARDLTAGALEAEGAEVCFACQMRWIEVQPDDYDAGRYAARMPDTAQLEMKGDVDPGSFLAGYLDGLEGRT